MTRTSLNLILGLTLTLILSAGCGGLDGLGGGDEDRAPELSSGDYRASGASSRDDCGLDYDHGGLNGSSVWIDVTGSSVEFLDIRHDLRGTAFSWEDTVVYDLNQSSDPLDCRLRWTDYSEGTITGDDAARWELGSRVETAGGSECFVFDEMLPCTSNISASLSK